MWPVAAVVWWNAKDAIVQCPYCGRQERHDTNMRSYYGSILERGVSSNFIRLAQCLLDGYLPYRLEFPDRTIGWEYSNGWFRRACFDSEDSKEPSTKDRRVPEFDYQNQLFQFEGLCRRAKSFSPLQYSSSSRHPGGDTPLIIEAREGGSNLQQILTNGGDINEINDALRTALMEGSFFSRQNSVLLLLVYGALPDLKDEDGNTALDLCGQGRMRSAGQRWGGEQEWHTRFISVMLGGRPVTPIAPPQKQSIPRGLDSKFFTANGELDFESMFTYRDGMSDEGSISLQLPFERLFVEDLKQTRTIGLLYRKGSFPFLIAVSGWNGKAIGPSELIDNKKATENVLSFSLQHGFSLKPGRSYSKKSHVEKQLILEFLYRHHFFSLTKTNIEKLSQVRPKFDLQSAVILVDNEPCQNCLEFALLIKKIFGVEFVFRTMQRCVKTKNQLKFKKHNKRNKRSTTSKSPNSAGNPSTPLSTRANSQRNRSWGYGNDDNEEEDDDGEDDYDGRDKNDYESGRETPITEGLYHRARVQSRSSDRIRGRSQSIRYRFEASDDEDELSLELPITPDSLENRAQSTTSKGRERARSPRSPQETAISTPESQLAALSMSSPPMPLTPTPTPTRSVRRRRIIYDNDEEDEYLNSSALCQRSNKKSRIEYILID